MLDVLLHGAQVGRIIRDSQTAVLSFVLDAAYAEDPSRPVLGQQFEDRRNHRTFRQAAHPGRLPAYFANLLPEGALLAMVAAQRPGGDDAQTLALLGEDLPGAVIIRPTERWQEAQQPGGKTFEEPLHQPDGSTGELRFSLAGAQLKFSAVRDPDLRFTLPFSGKGGRWILKFGSQRFPALPENEYFTMRWASRSGLDVPEHLLEPARTISGLDPRFLSLGENVFCIRRYDRAEDGRVHQEDFAQVRGVPPDPPDLKYTGASYEGLARFVGDLCGSDALVEFIRRLVFLVLSGNTDGHLKNWSLVYPDRRVARLSPAYDLVFVRQYLTRDSLALPLAKEKDPRRIGWEHFTRLERFLRERGLDLPVVQLAQEFATRALDVWQGSRGEMDVAYRESLDAYLQALPLAQVAPSR